MGAIDEHLTVGSHARPAVFQHGRGAVERALVVTHGHTLVGAFGKIIFQNCCRDLIIVKGHTVCIVCLSVEPPAAQVTHTVAIAVHMGVAEETHFLDAHVVEEPVVFTAAGGNNHGILVLVCREQDLDVRLIGFLAERDGCEVLRVLGDELLKVHEIKQQRLVCVAIARVAVFGHYIQRKGTVGVVVTEH